MDNIEIIYDQLKRNQIHIDQHTLVSIKTKIYTGCIKKKFTVGKFSLNERARKFGENFLLAEYV